MRYDYFYDPLHSGTLRAIDMTRFKIYGSDPDCRDWTARFMWISSNTIRVNFSAKKTHTGKKEMIATFTNGKTRLRWDDGNVWYRVGVSPSILLGNLSKKF